jgi:hypothetical protein
MQWPCRLVNINNGYFMVNWSYLGEKLKIKMLLMYIIMLLEKKKFHDYFFIFNIMLVTKNPKGSPIK